MKGKTILAILIIVGIMLANVTALALAAGSETADEPLIQQIDAYFTMTREELIGRLGTDFEEVYAGPEGVCDGYYYADLSIAFAFYPDSDALESIECSPDFKVRGVGIGNDFTEIMEALGDTEIIETWIELPIYTAYMVRYRLGESDYTFVAFEKDAPVQSLWISQMPSAESDTSDVLTGAWRTAKRDGAFMTLLLYPKDAFRLYRHDECGTL